MKESQFRKEDLQYVYGKYPFSVEQEGFDIESKEFAKSLMENLKTSGILDLMKKEKVSIMASSASTGKRDWEFLRRLNNYVGKFKKIHKPSVTLTDFALTQEKKPIVQKPEKEYENLDVQIVACDSYHLSFKKNEFQVLYERLGALWYAADEDIGRKGKGALIRNMLEEYKRVVKPGGQIIFDWSSQTEKPPHTTVGKINSVIEGDVRSFFENLGFKSELVGEKETLLVLTTPDSKSEK